MHTRLVHGTTLELRFHLAVKARVRLLAKRKRKVVASTPTRTLAAGNRKLLLALDRRRWPTKLDLKTHALAPLPLVSTRSPGTNTVGTGVVVLPRPGRSGLAVGRRRSGDRSVEHAPPRTPGVAGRRPPGLVTLACLSALAVSGILGTGGGDSASAQTSAGEPTPQTDDSVPASHVVRCSGPRRRRQKTRRGDSGRAAKHRCSCATCTAPGGRSGPACSTPAGRALAGFTLAEPRQQRAEPAGGQFTSAGSGVLVGEVPGTPPASGREVVLVRDPGGAFRETAPIPTEGEEALLSAGETLTATGRAPLLAPLDESGGHAGALLVPVSSKGAVEDTVLHWNGSKWASEPIEVPESSIGEFHVIGIGASSPSNAWLVGELSSGGIALFRRSAER